ncbi:LysR family transcriptional regulator [Deinococcus sp.]|uniref:LysR family transcriptional regulator n=1 Tax=Deinococcus sp. TaxID=47478 RepID=UPI002869A98D|nr:LysR family transcriptional regulator [Deinococcus sp.]
MATLESFRVFVAVYRAGSVSGAARERHLTQPAVSAQLAARVGEALFTRTPRGVVPTGHGRALYAQVSDSVDRLDRAARSLGSLPHHPGRCGWESRRSSCTASCCRACRSWT